MGTLRPRQAWGLGVLVACVGLLAVVAVVADGTPLQAPADDGSTDLFARLASAMEVALLIGGALVLVLLIVSLTGPRNRRPQLGNRRFLLRTLLMAAALALVAGSFGALRRDDPKPAPEREQTGVAQVSTVGADDANHRPTWPLTLIGSGVVVALAWAAWSARRRRRAFDGEVTVASEAEQRAAAGSAFAASLADLEAEPDPRRAIIAAYARLLDGLDAAGFGRRPSEAPEEHLRRTLAQLRIPDAPMRTLVALFSEARFSEHPLGAGDKQTAIAAVRAARDDLAGLAAAPGGGPS